jgi:hypothetical protein
MNEAPTAATINECRERGEMTLDVTSTGGPGCDRGNFAVTLSAPAAAQLPALAGPKQKVPVARARYSLVSKRDAARSSGDRDG